MRHDVSESTGTRETKKRNMTEKRETPKKNYVYNVSCERLNVTLSYRTNARSCAGRIVLEERTWQV